MKKDAFTLAEVLITLGIIGIVAAMTMPVLIANYQKKVTIAKLKKVYSTLSQGCKMALADDEVSDITETKFYSAISSGTWGVVDESSIIPKYYKISGDVNLVHASYTSDLSANGLTSYANEFYLSDGTKVYLYSPFNSSGSLHFFVNINPGRKKAYKNVDLFGIVLNSNCALDKNYRSDWNCVSSANFQHSANCFGSIVYNGWEIKYDFNSVKETQNNNTHHTHHTH